MCSDSECQPGAAAGWRASTRRLVEAPCASGPGLSAGGAMNPLRAGALASGLTLAGRGLGYARTAATVRG